MESIFELLRAEGLTGMSIRYDFREDKLHLSAAREWGRYRDFSEYNRRFYADDILTDEARRLNTNEVWDAADRHGATPYLRALCDCLREGKHWGVDLLYFDKYDIRFAMHRHSLKNGINNTRLAASCGGIRRHERSMPEFDSLRDGLNLSRAMTYKNIAAQIPFGGAKATVQMDPIDLENDEILGFLAYAIDRNKALMAPDMNLPAEIADAMKDKGYTVQCVGGKKAKTGPTGKPTAYGVYLSMKEALRFREGSPELKGKSVLVVGLGAVGWNLAEYLISEGAKLYVSDIREEQVAKFIAEHEGKVSGSFPADSVAEAEVDILSPCATGGLLTEENIAKLKCRYIWGSANNQLAAGSKEEEFRLAKLIAERGILYEAEWWHNTAGVMCMAEEYLNDSDEAALYEKIEAIIPGSTAEILREAEKAGVTATEACYAKCERLLYE